jgi:hypothetical protein
MQISHHARMRGEAHALMGLPPHAMYVMGRVVTVCCPCARPCVPVWDLSTKIVSYRAW